MVKKNKSALGNMMSAGVGTMVGVGMMGATASMVNQMPAGTAKSIAGVVPGLQATALVGHNLKMVKSSFGNGNEKHNRLNKSKTSKKLW